MYFYKYFFGYIFKSKNRQGLLFIATAGLLVSSFSLLVIQSVMGGLQSGLIARSKNVLGHGLMELRESEGQQEKFKAFERAGIEFFPEYEIELLAKNGNYLAPAILHGMDFSRGTPDFLSSKDLSGVVMGSELAQTLGAYFGSSTQYISPAHMDRLFGDLPRHVTEQASDFFISELTEIDSIHAWTRAGLAQNLTRTRSFNKIRFYGRDNFEKAQELFPDGEFKSWEEQNQSLVWALGLETNVMIFLFGSMTLLVALCVTSGFMIFYDKIKVDLMSLWVLGQSKKKILRLAFAFSQVLSLVFCSLGLVLGLGLLTVLNGIELSFMPDIFVERSIPIKITFSAVASSFAIPYLVASLFSWFSFSFFKKENASFVQNIRKIV